jgi:hypothetical protein
MDQRVAARIAEAATTDNRALDGAEREPYAATMQENSGWLNGFHAWHMAVVDWLRNR